MASTPSTSTDITDSPGCITYTPDRGIFGDIGINFERNVTAFVTLEVLNNVDDFCLISNPINCAPFDDIILCTKTKNINTIYLFQIKSKANPTEIIDDEFTSMICNKMKSKFFIGTFYEKYAPGINEIRKIIPRCYAVACRYIIIFFTNRPIQKKSEIFQLITEKLMFTTISGKIYKFKNEFIQNETNHDKRAFLQSIHVYAEQTDVDNSSTCWLKQHLNAGDVMAVKIKFEYFKFIKNWCEIKSERKSLTKEFIRKLLTFATLKNFLVPLDFYNESDYKKYQDVLPKDYSSLLWESIRNNNIQISYNHIQYILGKTIEEFQNHEDIYEENYEQIICEELQTPDIKKQLNYNIGCLLGIFPFIVRDFNLQLPPQEFLKYFKFVFMESKEDRSKHVLENDTCALNNITFLTIRTSSGQQIKIENLIEDVSENISFYDIFNIITACANNYKDQAEISIRRRLSKILLPRNGNLFSHNHKDIFIINLNGISEHLFFYYTNCNEKQVLSVEVENEITDYLVMCEKKSYCKKNKYFKFILINKQLVDLKTPLSVNVHFLKFNLPAFTFTNEESTLEWIKMNGKNKIIMEFRINIFGNNKNHKSCFCCIDFENINDYLEEKQFLIISGVPGMGKTTVLRHFAQFLHTNDLIIFVTLMKYYEYFETLEFNSEHTSAEQHITYFYEKQGDLVLKHVFNSKLKLKKIIILFDGFDEIAPRYTNTVAKAISKIRSENFRIILTTRTVLQNKVENLFGTISLNLCPFTPSDITDYLKLYFQKFVKNVCVDSSQFRDIIIKSADDKFLEVPLNLRLISDVVYKEIKDKKSLPSNFKISYLETYEKFINFKLKIFTEKILNTNINKLTIDRYHNYFAVNYLFNKLRNFHIIKAPLADALSNYSIELKTGGEKVGILIGDFNEIFIHRTVAEYFAAKWLFVVYNPPPDYQYIKNEKRFAVYVMKLIYSLKVNYKFQLFNSNDSMDFTVIKSFLEQMINNQTKLHQFVLKGDYQIVKNIIYSDNTTVKCLNSIKRTLMHTILLKNDLLYEKSTMKINTNLVEVLNLLLTNFQDILSQEDILAACVRDYIKPKSIDDYPLKIIIQKSVQGQYVYFNRHFELWEIFLKENFHECDITEVLQALQVQNAKLYTIVDAVRNGYGAAIEQYSKFGINAFDGKHLILYAAEYDQLNIVLFLSKYRFGINRTLDISDKKGRTTLHYAVLNGNLELVTYLMKNKVNFKSFDVDGLSPFHYAFMYNQINIANYFLKLGISFPCNNGYVPIEYVAAFCNEEMIKFLLNNAQVLNYKYKHKHSLIHNLLFIINAFTMSLVISPEEKIIYSNKYFNVIKLLLETGSNVNAKDINGMTPIMLAVYYNSIPSVVLLIENHADINCADNYGRSPLHLTAYKCNINIVKLILQHGININIKDNNNNTALHYAPYLYAKNECSKIVEILIQRGANPCSKNKNGVTPLHLAACDGHFEVLKLLLSPGNINVQDSNGYTALHYALTSQHLDIAEHLINNKADVNLTNNNNHFPMDIANAFSDLKKLASVLKEMGAKSHPNMFISRRDIQRKFPDRPCINHDEYNYFDKYDKLVQLVHNHYNPS